MSKKRNSAISQEIQDVQDQVTALNDNLKQEGEDIVKRVLPKKIAELTTLLADPVFQRTITDVLPDLNYLEKLKPLLETAGESKHETETEADENSAGDTDGIVTSRTPSSPRGKLQRTLSNASPAVAVDSAKQKKRRITALLPGEKNEARSNGKASADSDSSDDEGTAHLDVIVPCNQILIEMMDKLKIELKTAVEMVATVKIWIQLMIPKIEDGNNFGVGVQEECLGELGRVEDQGFGALDSINKYFQTRAKLVTKILKHPNILDYRQTILECDEMEYINLKISALDLRNNYIVMYDLLLKNLERIKAPRSNAGQSMMML